MKKLEPTFSSPQRHANPSQDLQQIKRDQPPHPFVKRPPQHHPNPLNTSSSLIKTFSKNRINSQRYPNKQKQSPARLLQRRSQSKSGNLKQVQRVSLSSQAYQQSPYMSSTSKLAKIGAIFYKKNQQQPKKMLTQLYQQNEEYLQLLFQWQRLEIYDELDRQVYKLIQHHIKTVQDVLLRSFQDLEIKLKGYQNILEKLQEENQKLREANKQNEYHKSFISSLQNRVIEEFEKNQWSSLIFQQFGRQNFDLQAFVRRIPTFQQLIKSSQRIYFHQQHKQKQESICKKLKICDPSQIRLTKSIASKQKPQQKRIQSHRQIAIFHK